MGALQRPGALTWSKVTQEEEVEEDATNRNCNDKHQLTHLDRNLTDGNIKAIYDYSDDLLLTSDVVSGPSC